jgi:hypothetical protein
MTHEDDSIIAFIVQLLDKTIAEAQPNLSEEDAEKAKIELLYAYFGSKWFGVMAEE